MKKIILIVLFATLIAFTLFWQFFLSGYLLLPSVERLVGSFYEQYNHREFKYIYDVLSHEKIRARMNPLQFETMMQDSYDKIGPVRERKRLAWKSKLTKTGRFFLVKYQVKRTKAISVDKFTLIKKNKDWFVYDYFIQAGKMEMK